MSLFTPINQKRLTNVSVVRLKKNGNRYELACYPNKVKAWREKLERDIDEVLQAQEVFSNVSKGQLATKSQLFRDFDSEDLDAIILQILKDGEIQVTVKERKVENDNLFRDVAKIVSEKCINPENHRAYTVTMIEKMMRDCHVNLQAKKSAKQQALEVIRQLRASGNFKIAPAMMEILISLDPKIVDDVSPHILKLVHHIVRQERNTEGIFELSAVIEPENYHDLAGMLNQHAKDRHCIEITGAARQHGGTRKLQPQPSSSAIAGPATILETPLLPSDDATIQDFADVPVKVGDVDSDRKYGPESRRTKESKKNKRRKNRQIGVKCEDDYSSSKRKQEESTT